jgi:tetrahydromethanopterin S-methyltransferase subunit G
MSIVSYIFYLDGKQGHEPDNWAEIKISASFVFTDSNENRISESVQPSINTDLFEFSNESAALIIAYRKAGLTGGPGIFEGLPFRIDISDGNTTITAFDGFINFKNSYKEIGGHKVECRVKELDSLDSFDDLTRVNTFEFLESEGVFKLSDYINIPFIVEPLDAEAQIAMLELTLFTVILEGIRLVKEIGKDIGIIVGLASTVVGLPGALILAVVTLLLDIVFLIVLVFQIGKLILRMVALLAPPVQFNRGMFLKDLIEKAVDHFGYKFETGIPELSTVAYMPAKGSGETKIFRGVPKIGEPGATVAGLINIALKISNGRLGIIDNTVHLRTDSDPFWIQNSTDQLADVGNIDADSLDLQSEEFVPNANEMFGTTVISLASDTSDQWTLSDDAGIDTQAIRSPIVVKDPRKVLINGIQEITIPCAQASRKSNSNLNETEKLLAQIQKKLKPLLDQVNKIYGNQLGANLNNIPGIPPQVITVVNYLSNDRIGAVRISSKSYSVPKLVPLENVSTTLKPDYRIPQNYRDLFSSLTIYNKYYISDSFANVNPGTRQRQLFRARDVNFVFSNYLKLKENSFIATSNGQRAKVEAIDWQPDADIATIDYWVEKQYTNNIKETLITTT